MEKSRVRSGAELMVMNDCPPRSGVPDYKSGEQPVSDMLLIKAQKDTVSAYIQEITVTVERCKTK